MTEPRRKFRRICVFCGSNTGHDPRFVEAARDFGARIARRGLGLVYGGGRVGLMGAVADGALSEGGEVLGVIPELLRSLELGHEGVTELFVVDGMHARKSMMANLSDAFVALPGGFGTLEEIFEATTWTQLNYHRKPVGLLNVGGYYDGLVGFLDGALASGFIRPIHRGLLATDSDPERLLDVLATAEIPELQQWMSKP
ncbi:MAG: TIGR00730 family Rossman fold protein [Deltaproteobacteria bacterium]|nr:TIGR00730 family Rossman fold protein [Deltaproteobacteria bacterium]